MAGDSPLIGACHPDRRRASGSPHPGVCPGARLLPACDKAFGPFRRAPESVAAQHPALAARLFFARTTFASVIESATAVLRSAWHGTVVRTASKAASPELPPIMPASRLKAQYFEYARPLYLRLALRLLPEHPRERFPERGLYRLLCKSVHR